MKKLLTISAVCVAMALSACAGTDHNADYSNEQMAPYADERTVGDQPAPEVQAERTFERRMRK